MRSSLIVVMAFGMGCGSDEAEKSDSATTSTTSSTCWFCTDTGTSTSKGTTESTKPSTTKDTGKPSTTYYGYGTGTTKDYGWISYPFDITTGQGDVYYYVEACTVYFEATGSEQLEDCDECIFALAIDLGEPYVMEGSCDDDAVMDVTQLRYGHSDAGLHAQGEGGVWTVVDGYSKLNGNDWSFTYLVD